MVKISSLPNPKEELQRYYLETLPKGDEVGEKWVKDILRNCYYWSLKNLSVFQIHPFPSRPVQITQVEGLRKQFGGELRVSPIYKEALEQFYDKHMSAYNSNWSNVIWLRECRDYFRMVEKDYTKALKFEEVLNDFEVSFPYDGPWNFSYYAKEVGNVKKGNL